MKKISTIILLASASLNLFAQDFSSESERKEANQIVLRCIYKYAVQLDDGFTNVETVARAAANSCRRESNNFVDVLIRGVYPIDRQRIAKASFDKDIEAATYFILSGRSEKRSNQ